MFIRNLEYQLIECHLHQNRDFCLFIHFCYPCVYNSALTQGKSSNTNSFFFFLKKILLVNLTERLTRN